MTEVTYKAVACPKCSKMAFAPHGDSETGQLLYQCAECSFSKVLPPPEKDNMEDPNLVRFREAHEKYLDWLADKVTTAYLEESTIQIYADRVEQRLRRMEENGQDDAFEEYRAFGSKAANNLYCMKLACEEAKKAGVKFDNSYVKSWREKRPKDAKWRWAG